MKKLELRNLSIKAFDGGDFEIEIFNRYPSISYYFSREDALKLRDWLNFILPKVSEDSKAALESLKKFCEEKENFESTSNIAFMFKCILERLENEKRT